MLMRTFYAVCLLASTAALPLAAPAQGAAGQSGAATAQAPGSRQSGTVKAVTPGDMVLTTAAGQDVAISLPATVKVLLIDPATHNIKDAQPGSVSDIAGGDRAIVSGTPADSGQGLTAVRVYLLKSGAIQALHAGQEEAWAHSVGGIVRSADASTDTLTVVNGSRTFTVHSAPATVVRRYSNGSVRFQDAAPSTFAAIQVGDQIQARGQRSPDGMTVSAEEIVDGSFSNYSGLLTTVDTTAGTVTLKDLATKKMVTVVVTPQTNLRQLSPGFGREGGGGHGAEAEHTGGEHSGGAPPSQARAQGSSAAPQHEGGPGGGAAGSGGAHRIDLARIMGRLPTQTLSDLKPGEAVMIVASRGDSSAQPTAITLLSGVESILAASPNGETTLSPWSLGSGGGEAEGGEAGGSGGGAR